MPKLLIINITSNQGSTGKISEQIGKIMQSRGWQVYLAHGKRRVNPSVLNAISFSSLIEEYLHALGSLIFDADGLCSFISTKRLVKIIEDIKPDVIQLNNIHGYYLNYKILFDYLNKTHIPIVMTLHDCWSFTGHCVHFVTANCNKWKFGCENCPLLHSRYKWSLIDRSKRNFELKKELIATNRNLHIVAVSKWLNDLLNDSIYTHIPRFVFHNGIDLSVFYPRNKEKNGKFRILSVSNVWIADKGLYDLYKLRKFLPIDLFEITLVGLSKKQIQQLPLGINGICHTANQSELADLYSASDVFVNPTYADTFPTVNLEALACGTPIITYRTGGSPESIDDKTGVVIDVGDVDSMASAIMKMKENPLSSLNCRSRAEEYFDQKNCFLSYANLYESIIHRTEIL